MHDWNFWEWLAYGSLWVTGLMEAASVGMLRAREIRRRLPRILRSHNWAFAPLILLSVSTVILVMQEIDRPLAPATTVPHEISVTPATQSPSPVLPPAPHEETPVPAKPAYVLPDIKLPDDLKQLTNNDVRSLCYTLNSYVDDFFKNYIYKTVEIEDKDKNNSDQRANDKRVLDEKINRDLRERFVTPVSRVQKELIKRLNDKNEVAIELPGGVLSANDMKTAAYHLIILANKLP